MFGDGDALFGPWCRSLIRDLFGFIEQVHLRGGVFLAGRAKVPAEQSALFLFQRLYTGLQMPDFPITSGQKALEFLGIIGQFRTIDELRIHK